jgi:predicted AAA+ superfamily ATPase
MSQKDPRVFRRDIKSDIVSWVNDKANEKIAPNEYLLIAGQRQIGKSTVVEGALSELASMKGYQFFEIDLVAAHLEADFESRLYAMSKDPKMILAYLYNEAKDSGQEPKTVPNFESGNQLILFIDEIQILDSIDCLAPLVTHEKVITVFTGSWFHARSQRSKLLTGKTLWMHPMSFYEFLDACFDYKKVTIPLRPWIEENTHKFLNGQNKIGVDSPQLDEANELLLEYLFLGGMPRVIEAYVFGKEKDAVDVRDSVIRDLSSGLAAYIPKSEISKRANILAAWGSIRPLFAKEEKEVLNAQQKNALLADDINLYQETGVATRALALTKLESVLANNASSEMKLYPSDPGIFSSALGIVNKDDIGNIKFDSFRGSIYESLLADMIVQEETLKPFSDVYFYRVVEEETGEHELDFVWESSYRQLVVIEAKAGKGHPKSMSHFLETKKGLLGIKSGGSVTYLTLTKQPLRVVIPTVFFPALLHSIKESLPSNWVNDSPE